MASSLIKKLPSIHSYVLILMLSRPLPQRAAKTNRFRFQDFFDSIIVLFFDAVRAWESSCLPFGEKANRQKRPVTSFLIGYFTLQHNPLIAPASPGQTDTTTVPPDRRPMPPRSPAPALAFILLLLLPPLSLLLGPLASMAAAASSEAAMAAASKPPCEHENGRLLLQRHDDADAEAAHRLSLRLHEVLTEWSAAPGGCRGEVIFEGAAHCGKVGTQQLHCL
jgi:hypothetical protein